MKLNFRGETIPEVLMVTLILGSVLSTAFALTSQVTGNSRSSQERSEASAYGQQQIERLKAQLNRDVPLTGNFCINDSNAVVTVGDPSVGGCPDAIYSRYRSNINYNVATQTYTASVKWDNSKGKGQDNLQLIYRVEYVSDAAGGGPGGPAPAPATDNCPNNAAPVGALQACYYNDISFGRFISRVNKSPISVTPTFTNALDDNFGLGSPSPEVDTDNFSGRYIGNFNFNAGTYVFYAGGDDGVRLFIDDNPVPLINEFRQQGYTEYTMSHTFLTAGLHKVRLEFYENRGAARATLSWGVEDVTLVEAESFPLQPGFDVQTDAAASATRAMRLLSSGATSRSVTTGAFQSVTVRAKGDSYRGSPILTLKINGVSVPGTPEKIVGSTTYFDYHFPNLNFPAGTYDVEYGFKVDACGDPSVGIPCLPEYDRNLYVDKLTFNQGNRTVGAEPAVQPPAPTPACSDVVPLNRFHACYYNGMNRNTFIFGRQETTMDNDWGTGSPGPGVNADQFSASYKGNFVIPAGNYTFTSTSDDGFRLLVNGITVIDQYNDHAPTEHTGTITLTGTNPHSLSVIYYENGGFAISKLRWQLTPPSVTYTSPGTFTVPAGTNSLTFELWGAQGGGVPGNAQAGGRGGYVRAALNVSPGENISINPGRMGQAGRQDGTTPLGGTNGGGNAGIWSDNYSGTMVYRSGGGGGGCTDIRRGGTGLANRILVAGGGGGANIQGTASGVGGYTSGSKGASGNYGNPYSGVYYLGEGGGGGSQTAGGAGGYASFGGDGQAGGSGVGGRGGSAQTYGYNAAGGGGGGCGYFGGGGGGVGFEGGNSGTGGGGSTYFGSAAYGVSTSNGVHAGDGIVKITY